MISPDEIRQKANRKYELFLNSYLRGLDIFPLVIRSDKKRPGNFAEFQSAQTELILNCKEKVGYGYSLTLKEKDMIHGRQQSIEQVYFETESDFLRYIKKVKEFEAFGGSVTLIMKSIPNLSEWIEKNALKVIEHDQAWPDLLKVCAYFLDNPKPNLYIRELPTNTPTKFIEQNVGIIKDLLNFLIPDSINPTESNFEKRFNLKFDEPKIRILVLDRNLAINSFSGLTDLTIRSSEFNALSLPVRRVVILENKTNFSNLMNFLSLPQMDSTIGIFGRGFGVEILKGAEWLRNIELIYWGDIDSHGFRILSTLRKSYSHTRSVLMDQQTFDKFYAGDMGTPEEEVSLNYLTDQELQVYKNVVSKNLRLEQERIPHGYVREVFQLFN